MATAPTDPYVTGAELAAHIGGAVGAVDAERCAYAATTALWQILERPRVGHRRAGWCQDSDPELRRGDIPRRPGTRWRIPARPVADHAGHGHVQHRQEVRSAGGSVAARRWHGWVTP